MRHAIVGGMIVAYGVALAHWGSWPLALTFAACALAAWLLAPCAARLAQRVGAVAHPGGRSGHAHATPVLGGLAIVIPLAVVLAVLGFGGSVKAFGLLAGLLMVCGVGLYDDVRHVRPRTKLLVQVLAAFVLLAAGFRLPGLGVHGIGYTELGVLSVPLMVLWVVFATNAMNLIDGLDGLAAALAGLAGIGLVWIGVHPMIAVALVGGVLGFLPHNLPRAKVFLGDSGSLPLGFLLAALVLELPAASNVPFAVALMAYPVGDVALAFTRRLLRNKPLLAGDRSHVHHKAALHLAGDAPALVAIVGFAFAQMAIGLLRPSLLSLALTFCAWFTLALVLMAAGRYRISNVLAARRPYRRLHVCARYGESLLRIADSHVEISRTLQHCIETLKLAEVDVPSIGLRVSSRETLRPPLAAHACRIDAHEVRWTTPLPRESESFERERETILLALLRLAMRRWHGCADPTVGTDAQAVRAYSPKLDSEGVQVS